MAEHYRGNVMSQPMPARHSALCPKLRRVRAISSRPG